LTAPLLVVGVLMLLAFLAGAWVAYACRVGRSPVPDLRAALPSRKPAEPKDAPPAFNLPRLKA
jgi:hypothetical protein